MSTCEGVSNLMRSYTEEELGEYLLRKECFKQNMEERRTMLPNVANALTSEVGALLSPELEKTRFVQFREKFSENMYFPKPKLGKPMPAFSKPNEVTNMSQTFGIKTKPDTTLYELILPKRNISDTNKEFFAFHDKKLISHHHYLPAERINRHYTSPPFQPEATFGKVLETNKEGKLVKNCLEGRESTAVISAVQNKFLERTESTLGNKLKSLCSNVTEDMIMGKPSDKPTCNVKSLIENSYPCIQNEELANAVVHLNKLRRRLFQRPDLHINDLRLELQRRDELHSGYLPLAAIVQVAYNYQLLMDAVKIHALLKHFQILKDEGQPSECVNYEAFCRLLQVQYPLPAIPKPVVVEKMHTNQTTYRNMCRDLTALKAQKCAKDAAAELRYKSIKEDIRFVQRTTAKDLVSPDIPTRFGLTPADFQFPRDKHELQRIFSRLLSDTEFEQVWSKLHEEKQDRYEMYTVNELRAAINPDTDYEIQTTKLKPLKTATNCLETKVKEKVEKQPEIVEKKSSLLLEINSKAGGDVVSDKEKKVRFADEH